MFIISSFLFFSLPQPLECFAGLKAEAAMAHSIIIVIEPHATSYRGKDIIIIDNRRPYNTVHVYKYIRQVLLKRCVASRRL